LDSFTQHIGRKADNGHPISGGFRDAARKFITSAITAAGLTKYEISPAEASLDGDGSPNLHQHYAVGDLHSPMELKDPLPKGQVRTGIDIDYYADDINGILDIPIPTVFYTFAPIFVAGKDGDSTYTIQNNSVRYDVSGGSSWTHRVWNWCSPGEFIEVDARRSSVLDYALDFCGVRRVLYYKVHHARPWSGCPNRAVVWLVPQYSHYRFRWIPNEINARRLERVEYASKVRKGWNINCYIDDDSTKMVSIGREGDDVSLSMKKADHDILLGLGSSMSVTSRMLGMGYEDQRELALFGQYYTGKTSERDEIALVGRPQAPPVHWPAAMLADVPETSYRAYSSPLITDVNTVPMAKRWEATSVSIDERITLVANDRTPGARVQGYAAEFVDLILAGARDGEPYSLEDTAVMLDKPSQTLRVKQIWETVDCPVRQLIECFIKNEPGNKPARIISSFPDMRYLLKFSSYSLKFRDEVLHAEHNSHWFCPGKTPIAIAQLVQDFATVTGKPVGIDFSNLDGSVSAWIQRHISNAVLLKYFNGSPELAAYLRMLISCPARSKLFGFSYLAGCGVRSGSPITCDGNTEIAGFVQYSAIRMTRPELTPKECFELLGPEFGDDGLADAQYKAAINKVAVDLGLKVKLEEYRPDEGLVFLARVFPDPVNTLTSFQDPLRTWQKLPLTSRDPNIPIADAAVDRVTGYLVTDKLSPLTGAYCHAMYRLYLDKCGSMEKRTARKSYFKEKPYWIHGDSFWPQSVEDEDLMRQCTSARTGLSVELIQELEQHLSTLKDPWAVPTVDREQESLLKNTLDADGLPVTGAVDHRIVHNESIILRAAGKHAKYSGVVDVTGVEGNRPPGNSLAHGAQRPGSVPGFSRSYVQQDAARDCQPPNEAEGGRLSQGRGGFTRGGGRGGGRSGTSQRNICRDVGGGGVGGSSDQPNSARRPPRGRCNQSGRAGSSRGIHS